MRLIKNRGAAYVISIVALFLSRFLLLSRSKDFFDSSQYTWRAVLPNILDVVTTGHPPFHPLYNFFSSLFYKTHLASSGEIAAALPSAFFGSLSIIVVFFLVKSLFGSKVAWISTVLYAINPFVWISQITILVDPVEHLFYFLSLFLFHKTLLQKDRVKGLVLAFSSGISIGLSGFAHTQVALWMLGFVAVYFLTRKQFNKTIILEDAFKVAAAFLGASLFVLLYLKVLVLAAGKRTDLEYVGYWEAAKYLFAGNAGDRDQISIVYYLRTLTVINSTIVLIVAFFGAATLLLRRKFLVFLMLAIWLVPASLLGSSFIYENLHGRTLIIAVLPITILVGFFILDKFSKIKLAVLFLVIFQLMAISFPLVLRYRLLPAANESLAEIEKKAQTKGVFVSTNITKTWASYDGEFVNFGDVGVSAQDVKEKVDFALSQRKPVYISSDAVSFPFFRYDGITYDIRSYPPKDYSAHQTLLSEIFRMNKVNLDEVNDYGFKQWVYRLGNRSLEDELNIIEKNLGKSDIVFGQVRAHGNPVVNASVSILSDDVCKTDIDDITRLDFVRCLIMRPRTEFWSLTDKEGWFYLPTASAKREKVVAFNSGNTVFEAKDELFVSKFSSTISQDFQGEFSKSKLLEKIDSIQGAFLVEATADGGNSPFRLYTFNADVKGTNRLEAEDIAGQSGHIEPLRTASGSKVKTHTKDDPSSYLISGPYKRLPKGRYRTVFKLNKVSGNQTKVVFDIVKDKATNTLAKKELFSNDVDSNSSLELIINNGEDTDDFEARVFVPQGVEISIDYLEIIPI